MANRLTKLDVARYQLGTAMDLFLRDRDPVSVQCLACGAAELIEKIAILNNIEPLSTHMLETRPDLDIAKLAMIQRQYWNAFKHMTTHKGDVRDDTETLVNFDDAKNDAALFVAWWDYQQVTRKLPLPAQVFQLWWYAQNERKVAPEADMADIRKVFPDIMSADRVERKRRLRRTIERYRNNKEILGDPRTEVGPLCSPTAYT